MQVVNYFYRCLSIVDVLQVSGYASLFAVNTVFYSQLLKTKVATGGVLQREVVLTSSDDCLVNLFNE